MKNAEANCNQGVGNCSNGDQIMAVFPRDPVNQKEGEVNSAPQGEDLLSLTRISLFSSWSHYSKD